MLRVLLPSNYTFVEAGRVILGSKTSNIAFWLLLKQCCKTSYTIFLFQLLPYILKDASRII